MGGAALAQQPLTPLAPPNGDVEPRPEPLSPPLNGDVAPQPSTDALEQLSSEAALLELPTDPSQVQVTFNQPITLEQAIELAQRNNRDLQIAELQVRQSQLQLREVRAALYPTLGVQAGITRSESANARIGVRALESQLEETTDPLERELLESQLENARDNVASNSFSGSLQLNYDVFTSGRRPASIRAAEAALQAAEDAFQTQFSQLRLDVAQDYYDMQQADELVRIAQAAVENAEISLRDTQALERAGLGTRFDVLQAEVQLANRRQQLTQALSQQIVARRQLVQRLSLNPNATISAADPVAVAGQWPLTLEESIVRSLQNRSELDQVLQQQQIAQQNRRIALGGLGPQLGFSSSFNLADDLTDNQLGNYGYSVGTQVSMVIFDGGAAKASARQQEVNDVIAQTQFANFKDLIRFQVEQNYYTLQASFTNIETNRQAVDQARESLRLARLRFQAGVGTQLEVSTAETELTQAESNLLQAVIDYNRSFVSLQRFVEPTQN
ncbi:TolC family protein [Synechococcales cyanobacterium C]|uniref:TolC family protein n=2 Tax=Petrachloros TaxID=2918834 RepID=A0A8K1ZZR9_9CYAN|nr:TolC family protein [Petrachloros mirabilis ULC683]